MPHARRLIFALAVFVPVLALMPFAAEGVAIDKDGNIYGAEVGPRAVKKYTKK